MHFSSTQLTLNFALLVALALSGCGDDTPAALDIEHEPAGENCATGGVRITSEDEVFYVCEPDPSGNADNDPSDNTDDDPAEDDRGITIERLPVGADGNTCRGEAMKITLPGPPVSETIVCVANDPLPEIFSSIFNTETVFFLMNDDVPERILACDDSEDVEEEVEYDLLLAGLLAKQRQHCMGEIFTLIGPIPAGGQLERMIGCMSLSAAGGRECHLEAAAELEGDDLCDDAAHQTYIDSCLDRLAEESEQDCEFDETVGPTPEESAWMAAFQQHTTMLNCLPYF